MSINSGHQTIVSEGYKWQEFPKEFLGIVSITIFHKVKTTSTIFFLRDLRRILSNFSWRSPTGDFKKLQRDDLLWTLTGQTFYIRDLCSRIIFLFSFPYVNQLSVIPSPSFTMERLRIIDISFVPSNNNKERSLDRVSESLVDFWGRRESWRRKELFLPYRLHRSKLIEKKILFLIRKYKSM